MTIAALPDHNFIPSPLWLIDVLHLLTLTLHFLAMNFLVGGIVFLLFARIRDKWSNPAVRTFLKLSPTLMAATVTLGVAPLLFAQLVFGRQLYSASIVSGTFWILIPLTAIVVYYFLYAGAFSKEGSDRPKTWLGIALVGFLFISHENSLSPFALYRGATLSSLPWTAGQAIAIVGMSIAAILITLLLLLHPRSPLKVTPDAGPAGDAAATQPPQP